MIKQSKIAVLGGDARQYYAADYLCRFFDEVAIWGFGDGVGSRSLVKRYNAPEEALKGSELCVLPIRVSMDGNTLSCPLDQTSKLELLYLLDIFSSNSTILGGSVSMGTLNEIHLQGNRYINYFEKEELQIKNALLSAEGALALGITETPFAMFGAKIAVLGYGRIAKFLCDKLSRMGAFVTVFARNANDRAIALSYGFNAYPFDNRFINNLSQDFDIIYNTVPSPIIDGLTASRISEQATFIELASFPGGIASEAAKLYRGKLIYADGLPGKFAPMTAGRIIAETIVQILTEEEYIT